MSSKDVAYYLQRAETEREMARSADRADVAEIHEELARLYDAMIVHKPLRPTLSIFKSRAA
jgi:hypothetical protein